MDDGEREGGKEEKEGCRCRPTGSDEGGPFGLWATTSAMCVSIFSADLAMLALWICGRQR